MSNSHLINANIHRAKEGARVLEDIARFQLHDEKLFHSFRELRHQIKILSPHYDASKDLGGVNLIENNIRTNLMEVIQANALRLQEALRVLEEMMQISTDKQLMKKLRFEAYGLHSKLYFSANKYLKHNLLEGLYLIVDTDVISYPLEEIIDVINRSTVNIVQYRNKSGSKKVVFKNAYKIKQQLDSKKLLIINDHIDIALDIADGIHIGQDDYPLERVRNIIPDNFIFGISSHNLTEAREAELYNPSYIAVGCLFETKSKNDVIPVSFDELQMICKDISKPLCAIGGINFNTLDKVLIDGVKMVALISYVWKTEDPLKTINEMHTKIIKRSVNVHNEEFLF